MPITSIPVEHGSFYAYIKELARKAPIDVETIQKFGLPGEARFAGGSESELAALVYELMLQSLDSLSQDERVLVETHLFTTGSAKTRLDRASKRLREIDADVSETHGKNNLGRSLQRYARLVAERLEVFRPTANPEISLLPRWFEVIAVTWCLRLDAEDHRRQHWERVVEVRSLIGDHPVVDLPLQWSGTGYREGKVKVLSGQDRSEAHRHQFLRSRPEGAHAIDWEVYFFDLGSPITPGSKQVLHYGEVLFDETDEFKPYIWQATARYGALARVEVIIDIPENYGVESMQVYREEPNPVAGTGYVPVAPATRVRRDEHGLLRHAWAGSEIDHRSRLTIHWENSYVKR